MLLCQAKPIVPKSTMRGGEGSAAGGIKYEEKIVIRQGQPQVVKVPVKKKVITIWKYWLCYFSF